VPTPTATPVPTPTATPVPTPTAVIVAAVPTPTPITYHGGPVMLGTVKLYLIFYGDLWPSHTAEMQVLTDFAHLVGGTPWANIGTSYYQVASGVTTSVSNSIVFGAQTTVTYTYGKSPAVANIQSIVTDTLNSGALPTDPNGVYFVLTDSSVTPPGFCTQYCGWHSALWYSPVATYMKYALIGNPTTLCPNSCAAQSIGPNFVPGSVSMGPDAMASIMAHEMSETMTNPLFSAWYDAEGEEDADKCSWSFGNVLQASNGASYNVQWTSGSLNRKFLIQENWNAALQGCAMSK